MRENLKRIKAEMFKRMVQRRRMQHETQRQRKKCRGNNEEQHSYYEAHATAAIKQQMKQTARYAYYKYNNIACESNKKV